MDQLLDESPIRICKNHRRAALATLVVGATLMWGAVAGLGTLVTWLAFAG